MSLSSLLLNLETPNEVRVRASPASLRSGPSARHIYPSLVLVQTRKTRPCLTERLLIGLKESNQTKKHSQTSSLKGICMMMCGDGIVEWVLSKN